MSRIWTRRRAVLGLLAGAASAKQALSLDASPRPQPRPNRAVVTKSVAQTLVDGAGLSGLVSFVVADVESGTILAEELGTSLMSPASTAKAVTALYALDRLGPGFQFETTLVATGPVVGGRLIGDLVLVGSGDPLLDSDALGEMAGSLKDIGINEITGRFLVYDSALPWVERIASEQPETAGYNPTITGLNLNFNRVHFEWKRAKPDYEITMQARARKFRPSITVSTMDIVDDRAPIFTFREEGGRDRWTVARHALGNDGARWLPVRRPVAYAGEAFQAMARDNGLELPKVARAWTAPEGTVLASHASSPMQDMLRGMLRYSTNLTAEVTGLQASASVSDMPTSLYGSAAEMNLWTAEKFGASNVLLVDHSGLGYKSRMTARDMVSILGNNDSREILRPLLRPFNIGDQVPGTEVLAKTGTHNFVSALAGYLDRPNGQPLAFAIFCGDAERRNAVPMEQRERPRGARTYANRARRLQQDLLKYWALNLQA